MAGDNRAYGGEIIVRSNSVLRVAHMYGLGSADTPTRVQAGGCLEVGGNTTVAEPVILEDPESTLCGVSGTNRWCGPITQSGPVRICAREDGSFLFTVPVSPSYDLVLSPELGACVALGANRNFWDHGLCAHGAGIVAIASDR